MTVEITKYPDRSQWPTLMRRAVAETQELHDTVASIMAQVREQGDKALRELALKYDGVQLGDLAVSPAEMQQACDQVSQELKTAIDQAAANIATFHKAQRMHELEVETSPGVTCCQRAVPITRVGLYIPGGNSPLFSTVLMLGLPARIAGCSQVVMCTPCGRDGKVNAAILYAARKCGISRIYKSGGAQAIAAMAWGTETIPRVSKIFGPGNRFVMEAKMQAQYNKVAIDMPAGPSEVMVVADGNADLRYVASDFLSQAEHGPDSQAMLVCQSSALAEAVATEVERQTALLPRASLVEQSLSKSRIIVLPTRQAMTDFANAYAAEHLIVQMERPWEIAERITAAGSVFVGHYSPESAGDYASGTNHTLPTSGWAAAYSGVNLDSYFHKITFQELSSEGLASLAPTITTMARAEGLEAHARAVEVRTRR